MTATITPLPEAIDGRKWRVAEGGGSCDTVGRVLQVPLGPDHHSRFIRNHELGHAKITPRVAAHKQCAKYGVSMDAMQICEDLRVHRYLDHAGVSRHGGVTPEEMSSLVERVRHSDRQLARILVGSYRTDDFGRALAAMSTRIAPDRLQHLQSQVHLIDRRMDSARNLFRPIGFRNATVPAARLFDTLFPENGKRPADDLPLAQVRSPRNGRVVKWGTMQVRHLPVSLTRSIPPTARQKTYRDEGCTLSAVHRLPIDGRIFSRSRSQKGGTVLIDGSGSMSFSPAELERIVVTAPAATVAVYSGHGRNGTLTVVARKGRMATADGIRSSRCGSGNIVDGPALEWLARHPAPRMWVSDGWVTGCHDQTSIDLSADVLRICTHADITRVEKAAAVCDLLKATQRR
jgi:hypothetical protein